MKNIPKWPERTADHPDRLASTGTLFASCFALSLVATITSCQNDTNFYDQDNDGYFIEEDDCYDFDPAIGPRYTDADGDGYGIGGPLDGCDLPEGEFATTDGDSDDNNPDANPGSSEVCDDVDNDCDGEADNGLTEYTHYRDADADGYCNITVVNVSCEVKLEGFIVGCEADCDDSNDNIYPGVTETCDGLDNNCDGQVDEGVSGSYYVDADGDTYGSSSADPIQGCSRPEGYRSNNADCDDRFNTVYPGNPEVCDGLDNNCDGTRDEGLGINYSGHIDQDLDGFYDSSLTQLVGQTDTCAEPPPNTGLTLWRGDCDDLDASRYPGAEEIDDEKSIDHDCGGNPFKDPSVGLASSEYLTLQDAILASEASFTLWVGPPADGEVWYERNISFGGRPITLHSVLDQTTIDADASPDDPASIFRLGSDDINLQIDGFTLTGGYASEGGGAIYIAGGSPALNNLVIQNNEASFGGGIRIAEGAEVTLDNVKVITNVASQSGGGISCVDSSLLILSSDISNNQAVNGGGIAGERCWLDIRDSDILDNAATSPNGVEGSGGGIYLNAQSLILEACNISDNRAEARGGGIFLQVMSDVEFDPSVLCSCDGATDLTTDVSTISDCSIDGNSAMVGGGMFVARSAPQIARCTITNNSALGYDENLTSDCQGRAGFFFGGGGIASFGSAASIVDSVLDGNEAHSGGGLFHGNPGLAACYEKITVSSSYITHNIARLQAVDSTCDSANNYSSCLTKAGGVQAMIEASFENSDISFNRSEYVAGGFLGWNATGTIDNCRFEGNSGTGLANGMWLNGGSWTVSNTLVKDHSLDGVRTDNATLNLINSTIVGNTGVGLNVINYGYTAPKVTLSNTIISHNGGPQLQADAYANLSYSECCGGCPEGGSNDGMPQLSIENSAFYYQDSSGGESAGLIFDCYASDDDSVMDTSAIGSYWTVEPDYLAYSDGKPSDVHLGFASPLRDAVLAGDDATLDPDGSPADVGCFGGPLADNFDLDRDGYPVYFWPGAINDAPGGYSSYDCDDLDATVYPGAVENGTDSDCDGIVDYLTFGWTQYQTYTATNDGIEEEANFQVSVTVDSASLVGMRDDCNDLRITDAESNLLSFWAEPGSCEAGMLKLWIRLPLLPLGNTEFRLYYGNSDVNSGAISAESSPSQVFWNVIDGTRVGWNFDTGNGTSFIDDTGHNYQGQLQYGPTWELGHSGTSLAFDGIDDYAIVSTESDMDFQYLGGNLSIALWFLNQGDDAGTLISNPWNGCGDYNYILTYGFNNTNDVSMTLGSVLSIDEITGTCAEFDDPSISSTPVPTDGSSTWHHGVMTLEQTGFWSLYLDGVQKFYFYGGFDSWYFPPDGTVDAYSLTLGTFFPYDAAETILPRQAFRGQIDDLRIYDRVLLVNEIEALADFDHMGFFLPDTYPGVELVRSENPDISVAKKE